MDLNGDMKSSALNRAAKRRAAQVQALQEVESFPTVSIVTAGCALGVGQQAAYRGVETGDIEVIKVADERRVTSAFVRKKLGLQAA